jgi:hypothetical protein
MNEKMRSASCTNDDFDENLFLEDQSIIQHPQIQITKGPNKRVILMTYNNIQLPSIREKDPP